MKHKKHHNHGIDTAVEEQISHKRRRRILFWLFSVLLLLFFLSNKDGIVDAFYDGVKQILPTKPKPIVQSKTALPKNVQQALVSLAKQEIKQEQASETLSGDQSTQVTMTSSPFTPLIESVQEVITTDPADRATLRLKKVDRLTAELQNLLENDKSDAAIDRAVQLIQVIGEETDKVVLDKNVQSDREILTMLISQYNRVQLVIQKLEDSLPMASFLKIEDARTKYLVTTAQNSINAAPNLDAIHNIATKEIEKIVGKDFTELKAIEVISDFENGIKPEAKQKLVGLERQLATEFEKRMLKLTHEVRTRKLQNYINLSYGNPLKQIKALNQIKNVLSDRDLILETEGLKELTLKKLEDRIFELKTKEDINQFVDRVLGNPEDIKVMTQLKLQVDSGTDEKRKTQFNQMIGSVQGKLVEFFGKDKRVVEKLPSSDLVDMLTISNLDAILKGSPAVSPDVKQALQDGKIRSIKAFIQNISEKDFISTSTLGLNPVGPSSDVRILLPNPQAIQILDTIKKELAASDQAKLAKALTSESALVQEHLLEHVNDPETFDAYSKLVTQNPEIKQLLQNSLDKNFLVTLSHKQKSIDTLAHNERQALYEKVQQIVQQIFITPDGQKPEEEKQLPQEIQQEIDTLRKELADRNVPPIETPSDVTLPEIAKLPDNVAQAIVQAAKDEIKDKNLSAEVKLDLTVQAKDLGVSEPTILPGNLLYPIKEIIRDIALLVKTDPLDRAAELLKQDNEKTLEAAKLIEMSQSQKTIDTALETIADVQSDFDKLKEHASELDTLKQQKPERVDKLVDTIIENGLARQTVLSAIEATVHGDEYVAVEKVRSEILKDGVDTLLQLTDNNVEKLTEKLETAINTEEGSQLKDIKAVELLTEIERTQPAPVQQVLDQAQGRIAATLETKLLAIPKEQRIQEVLDYADSQTGNPVRQFEAAEVLQDNFTNPETILLTEGIKDKAAENLEERISEITDATSRGKFVEAVLGDKPEDLKIVTEIAIRVEPPQQVTSEPLPIVEKIEDIKAVVEQNIIDAYKDKPQELAQTEFFQDVSVNAPDVVEVEVAQELNEVLSRSPEVDSKVVELAQKTEEKVIDKFIDSVSNLSETTVTADTAQALAPVPEIIAELVELKNEATPAQQAKIDVAIKAEVNLIQEHLVSNVDDLQTFQTYVEQIKENPVVSEVVQTVGGTEFVEAVAQKAQEVTVEVAKQEGELIATVQEVQKEIFSAPVSQPSVVEQTLPVIVQEEIQQIKQEIPQEQIPQVTVTAQVTVETPPSSVPAPTSEPAIQPTQIPEAKPPEKPVVPPAAIPQVPGL